MIYYNPTASKPGPTGDDAQDPGTHGNVQVQVVWVRGAWFVLQLASDLWRADHVTRRPV